MKNLIICLAVGLITAGCAAKGPACAIIKVANDVCTMVEYEGEDGKTYQVKLERQDVEQLAAEKAAKDGLPAPKKAEQPPKE
jgi:hypothetical protein